jgi:hypothetical protein
MNDVPDLLGKVTTKLIVKISTLARVGTKNGNIRGFNPFLLDVATASLTLGLFARSETCLSGGK